MKVALQRVQPSKGIIKNQTTAENSYNIELIPYLDDYIITVKASKATKILLILAKISFTHLIAGRSLMVTQPSVFEIFTPGDAVMVEIFACQNDIDIVASSNYSKISSN